MQRSLLVSNPNNLVLTKTRRFSKLMRQVSMSTSANILRQSNGKQLKYNYKSIRLEKKEDVKQSSQEWYSSPSQQYGYRLIMAESAPNQSHNLCLYFVTKEEAQKHWYTLVAQGISEQKEFKALFKQTIKQKGIDLRKRIADQMIEYLKIRKQEQIERQKIEEEKQLQSSRIERERWQREEQLRKAEELRLDRLRQEREFNERSRLHQQNETKQRRLKEEEQRMLREMNKDLFVFLVKSVKLNRQVMPEQLNLKVTICKQIQNINLVPSNQSKEYILYLLASPIKIAKSAQQLLKNPKIQLIVGASKSTEICSSTLNTKQLLYNNILGISMSIPMNAKKEIDYKKSSNKQLEDIHAQDCYPFLIDIQFFPKSQYEHSLELLRSPYLQKHPRTVPNHHGIIYNLPPWTESRIYTYQKYLNISPEASELSLYRISHLQKVLIKQFEKEENKSFGSEKIGSKHSSLNAETIMMLLANENYIKHSLKIAEKGIQKTKRLETYESLLRISDPKAGVSLSFNQIQYNQDVSDAYRDNLEQDYQRWISQKQKQSKHEKVKKILILYLSFRSLSINKIFYYNSALLPLAERILDLVESSLNIKQQQIEDNQIIKRSFWLLHSFVAKVSPYFSMFTKRLNQDINIIRSCLEKYMPQFNLKLNTEFKTLNRLVEKMLSLWSDEHPEFTFRLWDLLVYSSATGNSVKNVIPYIAITYLKHWQTHGEMEVVNINHFITNLFKNIKLLNITDDNAPSKPSTANNLDEIKKTLKPFSNYSLIYHLLFSLQNSIVEQVPLPSMETLTNKKSQIQSLKFIKSDPVVVNLMIKRVKIYNNIGVAPYKLILNHYSNPKISYLAYEGLDRFVFPNNYIRLQESGIIDIEVNCGRAKLITQKINLFSGKYDQLSKAYFRLFSTEENLSYSSQSGIQIVFIKESSQINSTSIKKNIQQKDFRKKILFKSTEHPGIDATNKLQTVFNNIMQPLDEFSPPCKNLKLSNNNSSVPEWLTNSELSFEQFRQLITIYSQETNQETLIKLFNTSFSYFKIIDNMNMGRFILYLILLCECNLVSKINLMFQLLLKYQCSKSRELNSESVQSLFKQVSTFFNIDQNISLYIPEVSILNCTLIFSNKSITPSKDITSLLSFWAYTCSKNKNSLDVLLGTSDNLLLFKKLLPESDVIRIEKQNGCTISVAYKTDKSVHIWSVLVDGEFNIIKRGEKQGLVYPEYIIPKNPTSRVQLLHNYENVISLTPSLPISKQAFTSIIYQSHLAKYFIQSEIGYGIIQNRNQLDSIHIFKEGVKIMEMPISNQYKTLLQFKNIVSESVIGNERGFGCSVLVETVVLNDINITFNVVESILRQKNFIQIHFYRIEDQLHQVQAQVEEVRFEILKNIIFEDLGVVRYENTITNWKPCRIIEEGSNHYKVLFEHIPNKYFRLAKQQVIKLNHQ